MYILIFLIILSLLVFIHELGHFLFAKMAGVRVEEFGFGYPPKLVGLGEFRGTKITLNWIPFGGFVKILGENYLEKSTDPGKKFTDVGKIWQILILVAGVTFNMLLAGLLFASTFLIGTAYPVDGEFGSRVINPEVMITSILPGSPAEMAGFKPGDVVENFSETTEVSQFISTSEGPITLNIKRGEIEESIKVTPTIQDGKRLIGIGMDKVGTLRLPLLSSLKQGFLMSGEIFVGTVKGLWTLLTGAFRGTADLSQVAGPVGIVSLVGEAYKLGLIYLLSFTAFISINLAVVNLIPFPALDGGRVLLVLIESIKGSRVNPRVFNAINTVGFLLLLVLMVIITFHDIAKLF